MKRTILIALVISVAAAVPASAQAPVADSYGGQGATAVQVAPSLNPPATETPAATPQSAPSLSAPADATDDAAASAPSQTATRQTAASRNAPEASQVADSAAPAVASPAEGLPFTGLDLAIILVGGIVLLAAGMVMRRLTSAPVRLG